MSHKCGFSTYILIETVCVESVALLLLCHSFPSTDSVSVRLELVFSAAAV